MSQYLGDISAYALAVSQGYTGTEEEYAELMASYATVGQTAVTAAQTATTKASEAATSATTATNKASEATTAAQTATTKAGEASTSASTATSAKDTAVSASQTATTKATEATTAAATAVSAKDDAVSANTAAQSAKTAAQTAQTGAETAAASVQSSAEQIATNTEDISQLKSELTALESGKAFADLFEETKKIGGIYANLAFEVGYSVATTSGAIGETTNMRYFAANIPGVCQVNVENCEKIRIELNPTYTARIYYAFFSDTAGTLVGEVVRHDVDGESYFEINPVPTGAKYINVGGYGTTTANTGNAAATTYVYGLESFFVGKLDTNLTDATLPAQGKATGDRITTLETLASNANLNKLRIVPNQHNINFVVKTGISNLYLGYGAGGDNTEEGYETPNDNGKYNTAVGYGAFNKNEDGDHCTAVGFTALKNNVTGDFNTVLGEDALFSNVSGSNNIAIGDHSGQNNNGNDNILIGARVMRPATSASGNIIIGKEAGSVLDSGSNNIIIGNGRNPSADTGNNILIGDSTHATVVIAGKTISFNQDGSVTWS